VLVAGAHAAVDGDVLHGVLLLVGLPRES